MAKAKPEGPLGYFEKSQELIRASESVSNEEQQILSLFKELKHIGDLDTKLRVVIHGLTTKKINGSEAEKDAAGEALRELQRLVEALANPKKAQEILGNMSGGSPLIIDARGYMYTGFHGNKEFEEGDRDKKNEMIVAVLTKYLKKYLGEYVTDAEKEQ